jgi:hypothetical protein
MGLHVIISDICKSALPDDELMIRYEFPAEWLNTDEMNVFEFILPYNNSGGDTNFRNYSVSVMSVFVFPIIQLTRLMVLGTMRFDLKLISRGRMHDDEGNQVRS